MCVCVDGKEGERKRKEKREVKSREAEGKERNCPHRCELDNEIDVATTRHTPQREGGRGGESQRAEDARQASLTVWLQGDSSWL